MTHPLPPGDDTAMALASTPAQGTRDALSQAPAAPVALPTPPSDTVPLVVLGASAGGLDALVQFFSACPTRTGVAWVVIQHLLPDHRSMMDSLLARHTTLPVALAEDGQVLQPDRVALIPPGKLMELQNGCLRLQDRPAGAFSLPIDLFLHSAAAALGPRCVAVVLSGTGSDGSRGVVALNEACGLVLAQAPQDARFDGMPRAAMDTGVVDAVLPAAELPAAALRFLAPWRQDAEAVLAAGPAVCLPTGLAGVVALLLEHCGLDFGDYKPATLQRRLQRRQMLLQLPVLDDYLQRLQDDPEELRQLHRDLLIGVTHFFRDPEVWEQWRVQVIAPLVAARRRHQTLRVWLAGVATGEEAYSVAMLITEEFERQQRGCQLKIFATDVSPHHVEAASLGLYGDAALAELDLARRARHFQPHGKGLWQVRPELRAQVVFAQHNLLGDPPFTRMDLVVCRNTLIYFNAAAQERALARLHFALSPGGHLLLGPSESLGPLESAFRTVDGRAKLYRRLAGAALPAMLHKGGLGLSAGTRRGRGPGEAPSDGLDADPVQLAQAALCAQHLPPAVLVDGQGQVLHFFGDLSPWMVPREGQATLQLLRLLPTGLAGPALALVHQVRQHRLPASTVLAWPPNAAAPASPASGKADAHAPLLRLQALPVSTDLVTLSFDAQCALQEAPATVSPDLLAAERLADLQQELDHARADLQAVLEEMETSHEEIQATNEELISANEELQSSNEELQALNEELHTVNAEYESKLAQLHRAHADLESMERAVGVATLFVDDHLRLTRFSPEAARLFRLQAGDLGRRLDDFSHDLLYPTLVEDLQHTLEHQQPVERPISHRDGQRGYLARIQSYRIPSRALAGAVLSFTDVTALQDARRLQSILDALPEHIAVLDEAGTIRLVNQAWRRFAAANGDPGLRHSGPGINYLQICNAAEEGGDARHAAFGLREVLGGTRDSFSLRYPCHTDTERRWFVMNVAPLQGHGFGAVVSHTNITSWYQQPSPAKPHDPR
ncbi:chemotaxis protein CheB [Ideonella livida]|uniref:protein-glutamate O-methyltransferase n=1 Tax=Ideonella livida TaxID=2707176 RepID=A0A7C9THB6_9BURK|nr:chemotaxis protein CheB [Ideonella livida]NDY90479.1 PAS domain-containing protein [Ideonella livida]